MDLNIFKSDVSNDIIDYLLINNNAFSQLSLEEKIEVRNLKLTPTFFETRNIYDKFSRYNLYY